MNRVGREGEFEGKLQKKYKCERLFQYNRQKQNRVPYVTYLCDKPVRKARMKDETSIVAQMKLLSIPIHLASACATRSSKF